MTWARWWLTVVLATVAAVLVSVLAGDFDPQKRAAKKEAAIERARATSGVDGTVSTRDWRQSHEH